MRRREIAGLFGVVMGVSLLAGCAKTPESSIVRQKGQTAIDNYKEAETEAAQTAEGTAGADGGAVKQEQKGKTLRERLSAPEQYRSEVTDETGKLKILTDAEVELPDASQVSAISVSQHPFDQDRIDQITETFFGDADIYDGRPYFMMTKSDWQARLEELNGYVAAGNLDPYHSGTDENGAPVYDIYEAIEAAEQQIETAPEERKKEKVHPQFGLEYDYGNGDIDTGDDSFDGIVSMEDGTGYEYRLKSYASHPMDVRIKKLRDPERFSENNCIWSEYLSLKESAPELPEEDEFQKEIGISLEEAQKIADEKVAQLDIPYMQMNAWEYEVQWLDGDMTEDGGYSRERQTDTGYLLHYTRCLDGVPITYIMEYGGAYEDMDSEVETWGYERLDVIVTKDGIAEVDLINQYDIGDVSTENLELLPFPEIMSVFEKMMLIQNADVINYEEARTYNINRITLGYGRIYEPAADSRSGLLVPIWNFFGNFEYSDEQDGTVYNGTNVTQYQSYMAINAVDGSVIDLAFGY